MLTTHPIYRRGERKSRAIPVLPLWVFVACYRVNFTFYLFECDKSWVKTNNEMNVGQKVYSRKISLLLTEIQMQIDAIPFVR